MRIDFAFALLNVSYPPLASIDIQSKKAMTIQKVLRYFYRFQTTSNKHTLGARCEPVGLCYKSSRCSLAQFFSSAAPKKLFLAALSPRPDFRVIELRSSAASVIKNRLDLFRSSLFWLRELDLNQRPSGYEPDELPDCSIPRHVTCIL